MTRTQIAQLATFIDTTPRRAYWTSPTGVKYEITGILLHEQFGPDQWIALLDDGNSIELAGVRTDDIVVMAPVAVEWLE